MALSNKEKRALADAVIAQMGNLVEILGDEPSGYYDAILYEADINDIVIQLAKWAERLPGDGWDIRLQQIPDR